MDVPENGIGGTKSSKYILPIIIDKFCVNIMTGIGALPPI
jgi:hypothetical protein